VFRRDGLIGNFEIGRIFFRRPAARAAEPLERKA